MELSKTEIENNPLLRKFVDEWIKRAEIQKVLDGMYEEMMHDMTGDSNITFPVFPEREEARAEPDVLDDETRRYLIDKIERLISDMRFIQQCFIDNKLLSIAGEISACCCILEEITYKLEVNEMSSVINKE